MLPQFYITMATESEDNMKVKDYKNIKDYIKKKEKYKDQLKFKEVFNKGITICIAKNCNEPLYHNQSTSNPKYCMSCAQKEYMIDLITYDHFLIGHFIIAMLISLILVIEK